MSRFNIRENLGLRRASTGGTPAPTQSQPKGSSSPSIAGTGTPRPMGSLANLVTRNSSSNSLNGPRRHSLGDLPEKMSSLFNRGRDALSSSGRAGSGQAPEHSARQQAFLNQDARPAIDRRHSAPAALGADVVTRLGIADPIKAKSGLRKAFSLSDLRSRTLETVVHPSKSSTELIGSKGDKPLKFTIEDDKKRFAEYMGSGPRNPSPMGYLKYTDGNGRMPKMRLSVGVRINGEDAFGARPPQTLKMKHEALMRNSFADMLALHHMPDDTDMQTMFDKNDTFASLFGDADTKLSKDPTFQKMVNDYQDNAQTAADKAAAHSRGRRSYDEY